MVNWIGGFKKATHVLAVVGVAAATWAVSSQGQQVIGGLVHAYPKLSWLTAAGGFLTILLHSPKA